MMPLMCTASDYKSNKTIINSIKYWLVFIKLFNETKCLIHLTQNTLLN